jgi:hypothetical protein
LTGFVNVSQYNKICSDRLQATLENTKGYGTLFNNSDSLDLLEMIKEVMFTQKVEKEPGNTSCGDPVAAHWVETI